MKIAKLIETQLSALASLEKRLAEKPSRQSAEKLGKEAVELRTRTIEGRIARLESQKAAALSRFDTALATEHAALAAACNQKAGPPTDEPVKRPRKTPVVKAKAAEA